jgi:hypothetical protein
MHRTLQDPIMLEATLLNAAVHLDTLYKTESSPLTLGHRGETIKLVNMTLDSPERVSDSNIGAVALLAWNGVCPILPTSFTITEQRLAHRITI